LAAAQTGKDRQLIAARKRLLYGDVSPGGGHMAGELDESRCMSRPDLAPQSRHGRVEGVTSSSELKDGRPARPS
jgi:hypothetical protein